MQQPDISILIVSWNVCDMVRDCILSIKNETSISHEIIVVDNDSKDKTVEIISSEFPDVRLIKNNTNKGFAAANNQAIEISKGRYVVLLNPDTVVMDGAIDTMVHWMDENPDIGCGGCQVYETKTDIQRTCFSDPSPLNLFMILSGIHRISKNNRFFGRPEYSWWDRDREMDVDVVSGMFMVVPRRVVDEVGMLDDAFFVYAEEADWCRRIRKTGHRCVFTPIAKILHRDGGSKSTVQIRPKMYIQLQKSQLIYTRKYYGNIGYLGVKGLFSAAMLARAVVLGLMSLINNKPRYRSTAHLAWVALKYHLLGTEPTS